MSAPTTIQRTAPAVGYPQQGVAAAPAPQASVATQKADIAFQFIKKIVDAEVTAFAGRAKNPSAQNIQGLVNVPVQDKVSGQISTFTVIAPNVLKYAAAAQLKKNGSF